MPAIGHVTIVVGELRSLSFVVLRLIRGIRCLNGNTHSFVAVDTYIFLWRNGLLLLGLFSFNDFLPAEARANVFWV